MTYKRAMFIGLKVNLVYLCSFFFFLKVIDSSLVNRCPHRSEIQSIVLSETESELRINNFIPSPVV